MSAAQITTDFAEIGPDKSETSFRIVGGAGNGKRISYLWDGPAAPRSKPNSTWALLAFLPLAMRAGFDLRCDEPIDEDILPQLEECMDAWALWLPKEVRPVRIIAENLVKARQPADKSAALAFSGGVDACYSLMAHKLGLIGRRTLDLQHAVLVQGFDIPVFNDRAFQASKADAEAILSEFEVPLTTVKTNWREQTVPWATSFIFALAAVMHQLHGVTSRAVISSDESYDNEVLGLGTNSITNPLMSGPSFPIEFTGAGATRTRKASVIARSAAVKRHIRVCYRQSFDGGNCGVCEKCTRTKLNFAAVGVYDIPRLGTPVRASDVRSLRISQKAVLNLFEDIRENGDWRKRTELLDAINDLVHRGLQPKKSWLSKTGSKLLASIRKRVIRLRLLMSRS